MAKASIIIPVYNRTDVLARALNSIQAQSWRDYDVIVVDDASTEDITKSFPANMPITYIRHERNKGASAARNTGIKTAQSPFVALLDSDDTWHPLKLEKQMQFMEGRHSENIKASFTSFNMIRPNARNVVRYLKPRKNWKEIIIDVCSVSPGSTLVAERTLFEDGNIGLYDENLPRLEDWDWLLRYATKHDFGIIQEPLCDVYVSGTPQTEAVAQSVERIWAKNRRLLLANFSRGTAQKFRASLDFELAGAAFRRREIFKALGLVVSGAFRSPQRFWSFIKRIYHKFRDGDYGTSLSLWRRK